MYKPKLPPITIIRDTREKENNGWWFDLEQKRPGRLQVIGTVEESLDAADYSVKGYEDLIRIERKAGMHELFGNMTPKDNKERFEREMERLRPVKYKYAIIETSLSNDLLSLSVPQIVHGPPASTIVKWLFDLQMEYGIVPVFAGACGQKIARYLIELAIRKHA